MAAGGWTQGGWTQGFRLGPLRLTPYGTAAAVGLLTAVGWSGRLGRQMGRRSGQGTGLTAEAVWDTGLFAVLACFVASRLLLVVMNFGAFRQYPLAVLGAPSLTVGGMVLAGVAVWGSLRYKQLPVLAMMDAFAAPGALLAAFLELGHALDGSEPGMPLSAVGKDGAVRLLPVSLYGVAAALAVTAVLWGSLRRGWSEGRVAALGLMLGGVAAFGLDMLSVPLEIGWDGPLEPGEWVALAVVLGGAVLWTCAVERSRASTPGDESGIPQGMKVS